MARKASDDARKHRRDLFDLGSDGIIAAIRDGDDEGAARIQEEMKQLKLVVPDQDGHLVKGPDIADDD